MGYYDKHLKYYAKATIMYFEERLSKLYSKTNQAYYKYDEERIMIRMSQKTFAIDYIREIRKKDHGIGGIKIWQMYNRKFAGNSPPEIAQFENVVDKYGLKLR